MKHSKYGFTLIELLAVVLIIGILGTIALPQYQKAVLKSRFSSLMPTTKAIVNGNEVYYLTHGRYADEVATLDVTTTSKAGTQLTLSNDMDYAYVLATQEDMKNNLIIYQRHSVNYPGEIHCEALTEDTQANWLCEENLKGTKLGEILTAGYTTYVLEGTGNGIAPGAQDGPQCNKALSLGYTCEITENQNGSSTKRVCSSEGICSVTTYNEDGSYNRTVCQLDANDVCQTKRESQYDKNGNKLLDTRCRSTNATGACVAYQPREEYYFTYDENGRVSTEKKCYTATIYNCTSYMTYLYTYDEAGNLTSAHVCNAFDENNNCTKYNSTMYSADYTYDDQGNQTSESKWYACTDTETCERKSGGTTYSIYNDQGQVAFSGNNCKSFTNGSCTQLDSPLFFTYDENGNQTSQRICKGTPVNGQCQEYTGYSNYYTYDDQGNQTSIKTCYGNNVNSIDGSCSTYNNTVEFTYTYDEENDLLLQRTCQSWEGSECTSWSPYY